MNIAYGSVDEDDKEDSDSEYDMLDPALLDLDMPVQDNVDRSTGPVLTTVEYISFSREVFYTFWSQLNEGQQHLFNFIMKQVQQPILNESNTLPNPYAFYIFFTGGAGVRKSFLDKCLAESMKKNSKFPRQNYSEEPSLAVTAFTCKAATYVNSTTLHSAF